jgi:hypothetical protein
MTVTEETTVTPYTFAEFYGVEAPDASTPTGRTMEIPADTLEGAVRGLCAQLSMTEGADPTIGDSGLTVYPQGQESGRFWVYQSPECLAEYKPGEFIRVRFAAVGSQLAQVIAVRSNGNLLVRKWIANSRRWTANTTISRRQVLGTTTPEEAARATGAAA